MRVVFSDLDGSFVAAENGRYAAVRPALDALERRSIPLISIGKGTRAELEAISRGLNVAHPMAIEDGGAVLVPEQYFPSSILDETWQRESTYYVHSFGLPYSHLRRVLQDVRVQMQADIVGFGDWTEAELALALGLSPEAAHLAHQREFSEIFTYTGKRALLEEEIERHHLQVQQLQTPTLQGLWYLTGNVERKGAVQSLLDCYQRHVGQVRSLGLGSYPHDLDWLRLMDRAIVVPSSTASDLVPKREFDWLEAPLPGPEGWNEAVLDWLAKTDDAEG
ncbi:hypothetical protein [Synechococcus sp. PCC 7336]|uniref:hypothetical protein n=1 Tax=Synechococcus sp. PCC 7336 TaxID=195250 RepID=UPI000346C9A5|nr:hypothetical protein [Synechococcus sp. PCC 7336]